MFIISSVLLLHSGGFSPPALLWVDFIACNKSKADVSVHGDDEKVITGGYEG